MDDRSQKVITVHVQRYDPEKDTSPHLEPYKVPLTAGMTILDCLFYIKEKIDGSLVFRSSCRMGICGSCGVIVNGFPRLACHTQVSEVARNKLVIRPLANFDLIRDLVVDMEPLFTKHRNIEPFIIDGEKTWSQARETLQMPQELLEYLQFAYCLQCGLCLAACPTFGTDPDFLGPQALTQAYRYCADSRDCGEKERLRVVTGSHGIFRCHLAGSCSEACPKGVDPALAVQLLRRIACQTALDQVANLFGRKEKRRYPPGKN